MQMIFDALFGSAVVLVLIILLGEFAGSPLPLSPLEWALVLGAGLVLGVLDRVMALAWVRRRR